jgi:hypothetical protein
LWLDVFVQIALCSHVYLNTGALVSESHALTAKCFCFGSPRD